MKYFNTLPQIASIDYKGNSIALTNLLARAEIASSLLNNSLLFYKYDIQDGDTPEIVADKYYGDSYRYWLVLFSNQIIDPQWDWPLASPQFQAYLFNKYATVAGGTQNVTAYTQSTTYQYLKTITTVDSISSTSTSVTITINQSVYANTTSQSTTKVFPSGATVTQNVLAIEQSIYDYENELNESKRNINLINSIYVPALESQFRSLMSV